MAAVAGSSRWRLPAAGVVLCTAVGRAYASRLGTPFIMDDASSIAAHRSIRGLWPIRPEVCLEMDAVAAATPAAEKALALAPLPADRRARYAYNLASIHAERGDLPAAERQLAVACAAGPSRADYARALESLRSHRSPEAIGARSTNSPAAMPQEAIL
jgi:hypothetical protein